MREALAAAVLALSLGCAVAAQAQAPSPDAPVAATDRTADDIDAWVNGPVRGVAATAPALDEAPVRDRAIHGEVGAAIGSNGYRSAYGVATMPLGDVGDLTVGVAGGHSDGFKTRDGQRWGGGDSKSLLVALRLGSGGEPRCGCPPAGYCAVPRWGVGLLSDARGCADPRAAEAGLRSRALDPWEGGGGRAGYGFGGRPGL